MMTSTQRPRIASIGVVCRIHPHFVLMRLEAPAFFARRFRTAATGTSLAFLRNAIGCMFVGWLCAAHTEHRCHFFASLRRPSVTLTCAVAAAEFLHSLT